jgi:hypothetical protein
VTAVQQPSADLASPAAVAVASSITFHIIDSGNQRLRQVCSGTISSMVGNISLGGDGDNIPATTAALSLSPSVAMDASGNVYIAEARKQAAIVCEKCQAV